MKMKNKLCAAAILTALLTGPAWANNFNLGVVDPVASQLAVYPENPGQALLSDTFNFSIAGGNSVTVDFQGMPSPGEGYMSVEYVLRETDTFITRGMWSSWSTPNFNTTYFSSNTYGGLSAGIDYSISLYGWGDPMSSATGSYRITLTAVAGTAPVPEPETYAMLLAGLGLLGLSKRRRVGKAV
jgi:hypothetical protein